MKMRFVAVTKAGETRTGYLDADTEESARLQLAKRGLTAQELSQNLTEAPVHIQTSDESPALSPDSSSKAGRFDWIRHLQWRRVCALAAGLVLCLSLLGWGISKVLGNKVYHLHLSGRMFVATRKKHTTDLRKRVHVFVWFSQAGFAVSRDGSLWAPKDKGWSKLLSHAKATYKLSNEGGYDLDLEVPLPRPPTECVVAFQARGFKRLVRRSQLLVKNNVFEAELAGVVMRSSQRKIASATTRRRAHK